MTNRYTDEEWHSIVLKTESGLVVSPPQQQKYACPEIGSPAFMQTIDHTLLKLEAKTAQFDDLCAEARVDGFAVCVSWTCVLGQVDLTDFGGRLSVYGHNMCRSVFRILEGRWSEWPVSLAFTRAPMICTTKHSK